MQLQIRTIHKHLGIPALHAHRHTILCRQWIRAREALKKRATTRSPAYTLEPNICFSSFLLTPSAACPPTIRRCHTKSVITKPQNVCVMRDIMCSGYVAGGNTRWFGANDPTNKLGPDPVTASKVVQDINARLSFEDDATGEYGSMMAFACPYAEVETASRDQVISITDRLLPWEVSKAAPAEKSFFPGGKSNYSLYKGLWQLNQVHFGEDVRATENMSFMSQVSAANLNPPRAYTHKRCRLLTTQNLWLTPMLSRAGRREQRPVLPRPAPQVQPVRTELLRARPRPGPLWSRRHPRRRERLGARTRP